MMSQGLHGQRSMRSCRTGRIAGAATDATFLLQYGNLRAMRDQSPGAAGCGTGPAADTLLIIHYRQLLCPPRHLHHSDCLLRADACATAAPAAGLLYNMRHGYDPKRQCPRGASLRTAAAAFLPPPRDAIRCVMGDNGYARALFLLQAQGTQRARGANRGTGAAVVAAIDIALSIAQVGLHHPLPSMHQPRRLQHPRRAVRKAESTPCTMGNKGFHIPRPCRHSGRGCIFSLTCRHLLCRGRQSSGCYTEQPDSQQSATTLIRHLIFLRLRRRCNLLPPLRQQLQRVVRAHAHAIIATDTAALVYPPGLHIDGIRLARPHARPAAEADFLLYARSQGSPMSQRPQHSPYRANRVTIQTIEKHTHQQRKTDTDSNEAQGPECILGGEQDSTQTQHGCSIRIQPRQHDIHPEQEGNKRPQGDSCTQPRMIPAIFSPTRLISAKASQSRHHILHDTQRAEPRAIYTPHQQRNHTPKRQKGTADPSAADGSVERRHPLSFFFPQEHGIRRQHPGRPNDEAQQNGDSEKAANMRQMFHRPHHRTEEETFQAKFPHFF